MHDLAGNPALNAKGYPDALYDYDEDGSLISEQFFGLDGNPAITTDVITGFPGETEEESAITVEFLKEIQFFEMHVFPYSKRK